MRRENTFKIDYSQLAVKPSVEKVYDFCRPVLGLQREDSKRLQCHRGGGCAFIKVSDLALAQKVVEEHDGKHEVDSDGKKHKLRITMEDGSVEVRVHDLPEDVPKEKVVDFLSAFGEVIAVREVSWGESNESEGIPLGIWSARMVIRRNIDSWVTIDGEQALVVYKGQLQSCRHCKEQAHTGISCVQNKKLLFQKSYANVAKQTGQTKGSNSDQLLKKPAGPRPPSKNAVALKTIAPPPNSMDHFPKLPQVSSKQGEFSGSKTRASSLPSSGDKSTCLQAQNSSVLTNPPLTPDEPFKKPSVVLRSQNKTGNGNETDDSSASSSSKRIRGRPAGKKPRRNDDDDERGEDYLL